MRFISSMLDQVSFKLNVEHPTPASIILVGASSSPHWSLYSTRTSWSIMASQALVMGCWIWCMNLHMYPRTSTKPSDSIPTNMPGYWLHLHLMLVIVMVMSDLSDRSLSALNLSYPWVTTSWYAQLAFMKHMQQRKSQMALASIPSWGGGPLVSV